MDPYSPSHPTDQDMDLESNSPATPEQDANQNQLPADQSLSDVVPLLFNSDAFACTHDVNNIQPNPDMDTLYDQTEDDLRAMSGSEDRQCVTAHSVEPVKENSPEVPKPDDSRPQVRSSDTHKRSSQLHRHRSRSRSRKRVESRLDDKKSRRSRSSSRHRVHKHRSRSRSNDRRRNRSRTPPRRSAIMIAYLVHVPVLGLQLSREDPVMRGDLLAFPMSRYRYAKLRTVTPPFR
ncbi:unnamed protein product [Heterobilharzia americana]|nr:unnamed protein product [Heterobilharzia americana]